MSDYRWAFDRTELVVPSLQLMLDRMRFRQTLEAHGIRNIGVVGSLQDRYQLLAIAPAERLKVSR